MPNNSLPSVEEALQSLRATGNQFATTPLDTQPLGEITHQHPRKGERPVKADTRVLQAIGKFYIAHRELRNLVRTRGGRVCRLARLKALWLIAKSFSQPRLIWSVSGFATYNFNCEAQADALEICYQYFTANKKQRPYLVVDGGACAGVLGLSGVLARKHGITSLGIVPLQGFASTAPRDIVIVPPRCETYLQREDTIVKIADVTLCIDGGEGTVREALFALRGGSVVLLFASSIGECWQQQRLEFTRAKREGRLIVCRSLDELPTCLARIAQVARHARRSRLYRIRRLSGMVLR